MRSLSQQTPSMKSMGASDTIDASFSSLKLERTYGGLLEGTKETASRYLSEELAEEYPMDEDNDGNALVIPAGECLPNWRCEAFLSSSYCIDTEDDGTVLSVCWFVEELGDSMQGLVDELMKSLDWKKRARRFSYDLF